MKQPQIPFPTLLSQLTDSDSQARLQALKSIMRRRTERGQAYSALLALLNDPEYRICKAAIKALGQFGDTQAVPALVKIITEHRLARLRLQAVSALAQIWMVLSDARPVEAGPPTGILGQQRYPQAVHWLIELLQDNRVEVQENAALALGLLADPLALDPLIACLAGGPLQVRCKAAWALGSLADQRATNPLIAALADHATLCEEAAWALIPLSTPQIIDQIVELLSSPNYRERAGAAQALGSLGDGRAVEPLLATLDDRKWSVRCNAATALGNLGDPRAVVPLIAMLADAEWWSRWYIIEALGKLGDPQAVEPLLMALGDCIVVNREFAAWALGELGDKRAVEPLTALLTDPFPSVRKEVTGALKRLAQV